MNLLHQELTQELDRLNYSQAYLGPYDVFYLENIAAKFDCRLAVLKCKDDLANQNLLQRTTQVFQEFNGRIQEIKQRAIANIAPMAQTTAELAKVDRVFTIMGLVGEAFKTSKPLVNEDFQKILRFQRYLSPALGDTPLDRQLRGVIQHAVGLAETYTDKSL